VQPQLTAAAEAFRRRTWHRLAAPPSLSQHTALVHCHCCSFAPH
jgi:hypothetical protein